MNHRWQQMVMIATASIIIVLLSYDHLQQQEALRADNAKLSRPLDIPTGFLWPKEILRLQAVMERHQKEAMQRESIQRKALRYGLTLDPEQEISDWNKQVEDAQKKDIQKSVDHSLKDRQIHPLFAPQDLEHAPRLWNLAMLGFQEQHIDTLVVMKYELTKASAWFLGEEDIQELQECPFCSVVVSYEKSMVLADRLSLSMGLEPCYETKKTTDICLGWRLPAREEWSMARGPLSQKWEYMIAPHQESSKTTPTGKKAPNVFGIHDIVGHLAEWSDQGEPIGVDLSGDIHQMLFSGVRFYRTQGHIEP